MTLKEKAEMSLTEHKQNKKNKTKNLEKGKVQSDDTKTEGGREDGY